MEIKDKKTGKVIAEVKPKEQVFWEDVIEKTQELIEQGKDNIKINELIVSGAKLKLLKFKR